MMDAAEAITLARQKLPLRELMRQYNDMPADAGKKSFRCPICSKKGASLLEASGRQWFKCFHVSCASGTHSDKGAWDEVGYLAYKHQCSRKEGFKTYLRLAGVDGAEKAPRRTSGAARSAPPEPEVSESLPAQGAQPDGVVIGSTVSAVDDGAPEPAAESDGSSGSSPGPSAQPASSGAPGGESLPDETDGEEEDGETSGGSGPGPNEALAAFYAGLKLSKEDEDALLKKRGLTSKTCRALGFRSSPESNQKLLEGLKDRFPMAALVRSGLWVEEQDGSTHPNRLFYGWGMTGRKL